MIRQLRESKAFKGFACLMGLNFLTQFFIPQLSFGLTSGPSQPEFSSFEPVATTDMVDLFSGDFTYNLPVLNVPGPHGSGYAMSLAYHSGVTPEMDASWVGLGWTLNPGAINRQKRGLPDDYDGDLVTVLNKVPSNVTVGVGVTAALELYSFQFLELGSSVRYNNYKGFSHIRSVNLMGANGMANLGFSMENGDFKTSAHINPGKLLNISRGLSKISSDNNYKDHVKSLSQNKQDKISMGMNLAGRLGAGIDAMASQYGMYLMNNDVRPSNISNFEGVSANFRFSVQGNPSPLHLSADVGIQGNYNQQWAEESADLEGYGYMYSNYAEHRNHENMMMDYSLEGDVPYSKRDRYLPIPFNGHDLYAVSGEGVRGAFRLYNRDIGYFHPTEKHSVTHMANLGLSPAAGPSSGIGFRIGYGQQNLDLKDWTNGNDDRHFGRTTESDESVFFRFNGDMGGSVDYGTSNDALRASVSINGNPGNKTGTYNFDEAIYVSELSSETGLTNKVKRAGRSSYIAWNTNRQMTEQVGNFPSRAYSRAASTESLTDRTQSAIGSRVGEFAVYNENGSRYTYGLPIHSRAEVQKNYGLFPGNTGIDPTDDLLIYTDAFHNEEPRHVTGQEALEPYPTAHLLTEITTSDYIDRTLDGPTRDDFGGYTKFNYTRVHGNSNYSDENNDDWFKWRMPYNGLSYGRNSPSDPRDDMASVSYGYKEMYYLESVETKTHIAYFVTNETDRTVGNNISLKGSGKLRYDAVDAKHNEEAASEDDKAVGANTQQYLEKIMLFAMDENGKPARLIKTVRMEYDYSLCEQAPNNMNTGPGQPDNGKLTLRKVWFESESNLNARIRPYTFDYNYKEFADYKPAVSSRYPGICSYANDFAFTQGNPDPQNPDYHISQTDRWGNYRADGLARAADYNPYMDQNPAANFDPAAWNLKQIHLPTGGDILVQYEQDDYGFVQDQRATAMATFSKNPDGLGYNLHAGAQFDLTDEEVGELAKLMDLLYVQQKEPVQFNFLFELKPGNSDACNTEMIKGYAPVEEIIHTGSEIIMRLDDDHLPVDFCQNFYKKNRNGRDGCLTDNLIDGDIDKKDVKSIAFQILQSFSPLPQDVDFCLTHVPFKSTFRIPVFKRKLGGGVRVKRLMMYDEGLEADHADAVLYGTEYDYTQASALNPDLRISSGVATNEPSAGRNANALVRFLDKRKDQKWWQALGDALDMSQFEGPLGESLLPSPSIGYAQVTTSNIHSGKSSPGFQVNHFKTLKDAPTTDGHWFQSNPTVDVTGIESKEDFLMLPLGFYNRFVSNLWRSQGYRFVQWDINGRPHSQISYTGNPNDPDTWAESSSTRYFYKSPGEQIPMYYGWDDIRLEEPGKEVDVTLARRSITDRSDDGTFDPDAGVGIFGTIPILFFATSLQFNQNIAEMHTHINSKVIRYPAILERVVSNTDGITTSVEHEAYNPETGAPVVTRYYDSHHDLTLNNQAHNGLYRNTNFPASQHYDMMGQKAYNEQALVKSESGDPCSLTMDKIEDANQNPKHFIEFGVEGSCAEEEDVICDAMNRFTAGDLILVRQNAANYEAIFHVGEKVDNRMNLLEPVKFEQQANQLDGDHSNVELVVLRSGKTNQLKASRGSITTYSDLHTPTELPMDQTQKALREGFASQLQTAFDALNDGQEVIMPAAGWDINLQWVDYEGNCSKMQGNLTVKLKADDSNLASSECCDERDSPCPEGLTITAPVGTTISYDSLAGKLAYSTNAACNPNYVECLTFCPASYPGQGLEGVIAAGAMTYDEDWRWSQYEFGGYPGVAFENSYESGILGKWRPKAAYSYKTDLISGNGPNGRIFSDAGVFAAFQFFNWDHPNGNPKEWIRTADITYYTPHGDALEERNALDLYSAARLSHGNTVTELTAQNAQFGQVLFNSFEDAETTGGWGNWTIEDDLGHSGDRCARIAWQQTPTNITIPSTNIDAKGVVVKFWIHTENQSEGSIKMRYIVDSPDLGTLSTHEAWCEKVTQVGDWTLYSAESVPSQATNHGITLEFHQFGEDIYVDDVKVQPRDAAMAGYVYDRTSLRLIATLDDQNFATYYQYNGDGKLIRQMIETERGLRTLKEQQYHTPEALRTQQP